MFAAIAAVAGLASCTAQAPKANMKSDVDSLSYMIGVLNTQGLNDFITTNLGIDSVHMGDFMKGLYEAMSMTSEKEKAYLAGMQIGNQVSLGFENTSKSIFANDSTQELSKDNFFAGFAEAVKGKATVSMEEARAFVQARTEAIKAKALEAKYGENKAAGEKFLAENKTKEGVVYFAYLVSVLRREANSVAVNYSKVNEIISTIICDDRTHNASGEVLLAFFEVLESCLQRNIVFLNTRKELVRVLPRLLDDSKVILKKL